MNEIKPNELNQLMSEKLFGLRDLRKSHGAAKEVLMLYFLC